MEGYQSGLSLSRKLQFTNAKFWDVSWPKATMFNRAPCLAGLGLPCWKIATWWSRPPDSLGALTNYCLWTVVPVPIWTHQMPNNCLKGNSRFCSVLRSARSNTYQFHWKIMDCLPIYSSGAMNSSRSWFSSRQHLRDKESTRRRQAACFSSVHFSSPILSIWWHEPLEKRTPVLRPRNTLLRVRRTHRRPATISGEGCPSKNLKTKAEKIWERPFSWQK